MDTNPLTSLKNSLNLLKEEFKKMESSYSALIQSDDRTHSEVGGGMSMIEDGIRELESAISYEEK